VEVEEEEKEEKEERVLQQLELLCPKWMRRQDAQSVYESRQAAS
jgi:hypothetical protein